MRSVNVGDRRGAHQAAAVDDDQVVADALDLAEQVRGDDDGDPELRADALDEVEHLVAAGGVEAVGRLVEQQQRGSWTRACASLTRCFMPVE